MARLHTRKRGASKSRKPAVKTVPTWVKLSKDEIISLVDKLAREGKTPAAIGQVLRDQYGIPSAKVMTGKRVVKIMEEKGSAPQYPADLMALIRRAVGMHKHLKANKKDTHNTQKLSHVEAKIKRLVKYYRGNKLPADWKYDPAKAELLVK
jgi:small subunit ribosomal protein S15